MNTRDKHLASSDKRLALCKKLFVCDKRKAFTLLEVLVALAVLAAGAATLSLYLGAFRRISALEFSRSDSALAAVAYIDSLAVSLPPCADTVYTRRASLTRNPPAINGNPEINTPPEINGNPAITITPVPAASLQWLEIRTPGYTFRRLSRCKKASR